MMRTITIDGQSSIDSMKKSSIGLNKIHLKPLFQKDAKKANLKSQMAYNQTMINFRDFQFGSLNEDSVTQLNNMNTRRSKQDTVLSDIESQRELSLQSKYKKNLNLVMSRNNRFSRENSVDVDAKNKLTPAVENRFIS